MEWIVYKTPLISENAFQRKILGYQSTAKATVRVAVRLIQSLMLRLLEMLHCKGRGVRTLTQIQSHPPTHPRQRRGHHRQFQLIPARTQCRRSSFLPRTIKDWHCLSKKIEAATLDNLRVKGLVPPPPPQLTLMTVNTDTNGTPGRTPQMPRRHNDQKLDRKPSKWRRHMMAYQC